MPDSRLWLLNHTGTVFSLSTAELKFKQLDNTWDDDVPVKRLAASHWCAWAIGHDHRVYLYVLSSDVPIRFPETIYENQRWNPVHGFSQKAMLPSDRSPWSDESGHNYRPKENVRLPSAHWEWEGDWFIDDNLRGEVMGIEGWQYAFDFPAVYTPERHWNSFVRKRKWVRFRRYCSMHVWARISDMEVVEKSECFIDINIGGFLLPSQPAGFLSVWAVTNSGNVYVRTNVYQDNPEGSSWHQIAVSEQNGVINISVGATNLVWAVTWDGHGLVRTNVSRTNIYGSDWHLVDYPDEETRIMQVSVGKNAVWALSRDGSVWFRKGTSGDDTFWSESAAVGTGWIKMVGKMSQISVTSNDQVFAIDLLSKSVFFRTGITRSDLTGKTWQEVKLTEDMTKLVEQGLLSQGEVCSCGDPDEICAVHGESRSRVPSVASYSSSVSTSTGVDETSSDIGRIYPNSLNPFVPFFEAVPPAWEGSGMKETDPFINEQGDLELSPDCDQPVQPAYGQSASLSNSIPLGTDAMNMHAVPVLPDCSLVLNKNISSEVPGTVQDAMESLKHPSRDLNSTAAATLPPPASQALTVTELSVQYEDANGNLSSLASTTLQPNLSSYVNGAKDDSISDMMSSISSTVTQGSCQSYRENNSETSTPLTSFYSSPQSDNLLETSLPEHTSTPKTVFPYQNSSGDQEKLEGSESKGSSQELKTDANSVVSALQSVQTTSVSDQEVAAGDQAGQFSSQNLDTEDQKQNVKENVVNDSQQTIDSISLADKNNIWQNGVSSSEVFCDLPEVDRDILSETSATATDAAFVTIVSPAKPGGSMFAIKHLIHNIQEKGSSFISQGINKVKERTAETKSGDFLPPVQSCEKLDLGEEVKPLKTSSSKSKLPKPKNSPRTKHLSLSVPDSESDDIVFKSHKKKKKKARIIDFDNTDGGNQSDNSSSHLEDSMSSLNTSGYQDTGSLSHSFQIGSEGFTTSTRSSDQGSDFYSNPPDSISIKDDVFEQGSSVLDIPGSGSPSLSVKNSDITLSQPSNSVTNVTDLSLSNTISTENATGHSQTEYVTDLSLSKTANANSTDLSQTEYIDKGDSASVSQSKQFNNNKISATDQFCKTLADHVPDSLHSNKTDNNCDIDTSLKNPANVDIKSSMKTTDSGNGPVISTENVDMDIASAVTTCARVNIDYESSVNTSENADIANEPAVNTSENADIANEAAVNMSENADVANEAAVNTSENADIAKEAAVNTSETTAISNEPAVNTSKNSDIPNKPAVNTSENADIANEAAVNMSENADVANEAAVNTSENADIAKEAAVNTSETTAISNEPAVNTSKNSDIPNKPAVNTSENADIVNEAAVNTSETTAIANEPAVNTSKNSDIANEPAVNTSENAGPTDEVGDKDGISKPSDKPSITFHMEPSIHHVIQTEPHDLSELTHMPVSDHNKDEVDGSTLMEGLIRLRSDMVPDTGSVSSAGDAGSSNVSPGSTPSKKTQVLVQQDSVGSQQNKRSAEFAISRLSSFNSSTGSDDIIDFVTDLMTDGEDEKDETEKIDEIPAAAVTDDASDTNIDKEERREETLRTDTVTRSLSGRISQTSLLAGDSSSGADLTDVLSVKSGMVNEGPLYELKPVRKVIKYRKTSSPSPPYNASQPILSASLMTQAQPRLSWKWLDATSCVIEDSNTVDWLQSSHKESEGTKLVKTISKALRDDFLHKIISRNKEESSYFRHMEQAVERTTWVKKASMQFYHYDRRSRWIACNVELEQGLGNATEGCLTVHYVHKKVPKNMQIALTEMICVKASSDPDLQNAFTVYTSMTNIIHQPLMLKTNSEQEATEWIGYLCAANATTWNLNRPIAPGAIWSCTFTGDVFVSPHSAVPQKPFDRCWGQHGGHFSQVEAGHSGVTWAIGFDKMPYVYNGGYGGAVNTGQSYMSEGTEQVTDTRKVCVYENEKWFPVVGWCSKGVFSNNFHWITETGKTVASKDAVKLPSSKWHWVSDWAVDFSTPGGVNSHGWQFANKLCGPFHASQHLSDGYRRRRWVRQCRITLNGPWSMAGSLALLDISIQVDPLRFSNDMVSMWAVGANGDVLCRHGVHLHKPLGTSWIHVATDLDKPFKSISVGGNYRVWGIASDGSAWFRSGVTLTNPTGKFWSQVVPPPPSHFVLHQLSVGGTAVWAVDTGDNLWRRENITPTFPEGTGWEFVASQVKRVSVGQQDQVWVVTDANFCKMKHGPGVIYNRVGITRRKPSGTDWEVVIGSGWAYVSVRGMQDTGDSETETPELEEEEEWDR